MAERTCHNCVYACCDPCQWLRLMWLGEPILPRCANHPLWPGQLHEVPGVPCRNYRPRFAVPEGDNVRLIALGDGCYSYVDAADYEWAGQYNWRLSNGYAARFENGKTLLMHRELMRPPKGKLVDHIDGNKANNCRWNLRVCTRAQNMRNKRKHSGSYSIYKCVFYDTRTGRWFARCRYQGKNRVIGYYAAEIEAARAYDRQAVEWFGEYARLNFPQEWPPERRAQVYANRREPQEQGKRKKSKSKSRKGKSEAAAARAGTRGRRDRKRTTRSAAAPAPKPDERAKTKKSKVKRQR